MICPNISLDITMFRYNHLSFLIFYFQDIIISTLKTKYLFNDLHCDVCKDCTQ